MNSKKWFFISGIAIVAVLAAVLLAPLAFAQSPVDGPVGPQVGAPLNGGTFGPMPGSQMFGRGGRMGMSGFASGPMGQRGQGAGPGFVDNNGDGVCDNFVDENGDGVCDRAGTGQGGRGAGFVDNNGDGVCDYAGQGGQMPGRGPRRGGMQGQMMGRWGQSQ